MKRTPIMIGADPELFVMKKGMFISANDLLPGTKYDPFPVKDGAVQVDGTAAEFNIDPTENSEEFVRRIGSVMHIMTDMIHHVDKSFRLVAIPVADYDKDYFETIPDEAKVLGCEPDYDAWTGEPNPKPDADLTFRTGSGHVHIGWTEDQDPHSVDHFTDCRMTTKQLDSVLFPMSFSWDEDRKRRLLYGNKGAFRPKPYGAEYRVLSNAWLEDPAIIKWVHEATTTAMRLLEDREFLYKRKYVRDTHTKIATNGGLNSKEIAHYMAFLKTFGIPELPEDYTKVYYGTTVEAK